MSNEKMLLARNLIKAHEYTQARKLLIGIDHPKAKEWLAKIEAIQPSMPKDFAPFQPMALMLFSPLITPIGSLLLLGINWRRLGKKKWIIDTALTGVLVFLLAAIGIGVVPLMIESSALRWGLILAAFSLPFAAVAAISVIQSDAVHLYLQRDFRQFRSHRYPLLEGILSALVLALVFFAIGLFAWQPLDSLFFKSMQPIEVTTRSAMTLNLPDGWNTEDIAQIELCNLSPILTCLSAASQGFGRSPTVLWMRADVPAERIRYQDVTDIERWLIGDGRDKLANYTFIGRDRLSIGEQDAIRRTFMYTDTNTGQQVAMMSVLFNINDRAYLFLAIASDSAQLERFSSDFEMLYSQTNMLQ